MNSIDCTHWIGGKAEAGQGTPFEVHSPWDGSLIGKGRAASAADLEHAVSSASKASIAWGAASQKERSVVLHRFREILLRDADLVAALASKECGKTVAEARAGLMKGIEVLEFAISLENLDQGGRMEVSRGVSCEFRRMPLGVVAGITPFNFPAMVPMWMIPIAIGVGNSFILKPSDKTPLTPGLLAKAFAEAGLPAGVFSVLHGGRETVEALIDHPGISAIGFVGSSPIAKSVYVRASQNGKRALALGGAKNHVILLPDADVEMAARGITDSFTGCAGQRCMAASALIVVGDGEAVLKRVRENAAAIKVGETMGAIITRESLERISGAIDRAVASGAKLVLDGRRADPGSKFKAGNWMGPTILDQVKPGSEAACEELFGPVLSIMRVASLSEALAIQHTSPYGNAASVFTSNGAAAERVARESKAGMIGINIGVPVPREPFSFGGIDISKYGHGEITGQGALSLWSNLKKVTTKWAPTVDQNWMS